MVLATMANSGGEFDTSAVLRLNAPAKGAEDHRTLKLEERIAQLYEELRLPLYRYLVCLKITPEEAEETIQDTFLRLYEHLHAGKREDSVRGWIYRVAHNLAVDLRRHQRHVTDASQKTWEAIHESTYDPSPGPEEVFLRREHLHRVNQVIDGLSDLQRNCLYLRMEGFRYREIAEIVGVTVSVVAGSLHQAMQKVTTD